MWTRWTAAPQCGVRSHGVLPWSSWKWESLRTTIQEREQHEQREQRRRTITSQNFSNEPTGTPGCPQRRCPWHPGGSRSLQVWWCLMASVTKLRPSKTIQKEKLGKKHSSKSMRNETLNLLERMHPQLLPVLHLHWGGHPSSQLQMRQDVGQQARTDEVPHRLTIDIQDVDGNDSISTKHRQTRAKITAHRTVADPSKSVASIEDCWVPPHGSPACLFLPVHVRQNVWLPRAIKVEVWRTRLGTATCSVHCYQLSFNTQHAAVEMELSGNNSSGACCHTSQGSYIHVGLI